MIWSNNTRVFSLRYVHAYFNDQPTSFLTFIPTANTKNLMERYNILINGLTNGFDLYANTSQTVEEYLNYLNNTTQIESFDFDVATSDPLFYNYTDLEIDWQGILEFDSDRSQYDAVTNTFGLEQRLSDPTETRTTATVSISFADIINAIADYQEANYEMSFAVRFTQWRYYIINNSNLTFESLTIDSGENNLFGEATKQTLDNGQEALMFSSGNNTLPLSDAPKYQFNLVANEQINGVPQEQARSIVFRGLPNANPNNFNLIEENQETVFVSPMYIYI
ncbi:MAG: hypothetical protein ABJM06_07885 [Gilvibacter sp.]